MKMYSPVQYMDLPRGYCWLVWFLEGVAIFNDEVDLFSSSEKAVMLPMNWYFVDKDQHGKT